MTGRVVQDTTSGVEGVAGQLCRRVIDVPLYPEDAIRDYAERLRKAEDELERYRVDAERQAMEDEMVADGWQLEPTTKMIEAFYQAYERHLSCERWESPFSNGYEAMLKAAKGDAV